jgi:NAD(P)-dependent dehydrogenase (short-subunit alcohol dehydrogenase family)
MSEPDYFEGKAFLITGAASGIGKATALELLARGARVAGADLDASGLAVMRDELAQNHPDSFRALPGDASLKADCESFVAQTVEAFGQLDGVIHSAGVTMRGLAKDTTSEVNHRLMNISYFGLTYLFAAAYPHLKATGGHLVALSSVAGLIGTQLRSGYSAAKHAVRGWMDSVRIEMREDHIHVMTVSPGFVRTNASLNALSADGSPHGVMDKSLAQGLEVSDVARGILEGMHLRKRDLVPAGLRERAAVMLGRANPTVLDWVLRRAKVY